MNNILTRKEAIEFLSIEEKMFDNYFKNADEFNALPRPSRRGRFKFSKKELEN